MKYRDALLEDIYLSNRDRIRSAGSILQKATSVRMHESWFSGCKPERERVLIRIGIESCASIYLWSIDGPGVYVSVQFQACLYSKSSNIIPRLALS